MSQKKINIAVVLSGCGQRDGSEIHEAVTALLAIDGIGGMYQCFAPDSEQNATINAVTMQKTAVHGEPCNRNMMIEGARIARGNIKPLSTLNVKDFDAVIFPGGAGAINNLSNFAEKQENCDVLPDVARVITEAYNSDVVIGAMCIAPVIVAKVLGKHHVKVTIGNDKATADIIEKMGAVHENCLATDACIDEKNKIVTTPCYMLAKSIKEVFEGNIALINAIALLAK